MTHYSKVPYLVAVSCLAIAVASATSACAQCSTCGPTPVVAYSPVIAAPVVAAPVVAAAPVVTYEPYRGWYPGKLLDTWRMRRYGYTAPTATYTAAYAPYTVGYAPATYMAAYAPATYSAAYAPYTAAYAPAYTTTNYSTPYVTSYAPLGQRQVLMRPVVVESSVVAAAPIVGSGCSTCSACEVAAPCSSCAATTTVVEQATYAAAPAPCAGCAQGSTITYADQAAPTTPGQTAQPQLTPQEAAPLRSNYPDVTPPQGTQQTDPGPAAEEDKSSKSSTYFEPPALYIPTDRTAEEETVKPANRAPSVNVWNAVYRQQVDADNVSTTTARSQAEIDAAGWSSVPAN
jgi:hypothetical protein